VSAATPPATAEVANPTGEGDAQRPRWPRRRKVAVGVVTVLAAAGVVVAITDPFGTGGQANVGGVGSTSLATVTQRSLSSQTNVDATLGYAGSYTVVRPGGQESGTQSWGTFTALPTVGQVVNQGQSLYSVDGSPVVLLYGSTPAYRALSEGMSGTDVQELNANLVELGYATSGELDPSSDQFSGGTASALEQLQATLGLDQTGRLALGQAVFLPSAARITSVSATLGAGAQTGATVLEATSTTREVVVPLDATQQSDVKADDHVTITLPGNQTTPGVVWSVGTVATAPSSGSSGGGGGSGSSSSGSSSSAPGSSASGSGSSGTPTVEVDVIPTDPAATGSLDQAPVQVSITTASVDNALVVPVDALLAQSNGRYAVEVVGRNGAHDLVPVSLGLFDDADGLVQVTGSRLVAGQHVVVPAQ
jgi:Putative peptidoglycan binding domain